MTGCVDHQRCLQEKQTLIVELEALKTKHTETTDFCEALIGECYQLYIYSEQCSEELKRLKPTI